jgi:hypothetical protein
LLSAVRAPAAASRRQPGHGAGKRAAAKADRTQTYASSPRNATGGYSPSNPNVHTTICY